MLEITCLDKEGNLVEHLTQWDIDQYIVINNTGLTTAPKIHFCNTNSKEALVVESTIKDGAVTAKIPNVLLQEGLLILAYLYVYAPEISTVSAKTRATIRIPVRPRPKPSNYPYIENVDYISASKIEEKIKNELASMRGKYDSALSDIEVRCEELADNFAKAENNLSDKYAETEENLSNKYAEVEDDLRNSFNKTVNILLKNFADGSPKGTFKDETDLIGKESGLYLNETDGWVYFWDGTKLSDGICQYQSSYPFEPPALTEVSPDGTKVGAAGWTGTGFFCHQVGTRYSVQDSVSLPQNINGYNRFCLKPLSDTEEWWIWTPFYTPLYEFFYVPARGVYETLIPSGAPSPEAVIENIIWVRKPPIQLVYGKPSYLIGVKDYQTPTNPPPYVKFISIDNLRSLAAGNYPDAVDSAIISAIVSGRGSSIPRWGDLNKQQCIYLMLTSDIRFNGEFGEGESILINAMASGEGTSAGINSIDQGFPGIQNPEWDSNVYGVSIDLTNSDPEKSVTYIGNAVGMLPGSYAWDATPIFENIKPCLFKDGAVVGYLNPNNFAEFEDGSPADITSGEAGDVMIEIPKMGYKIETKGDILNVCVTTSPDKEGFSYLAHTRNVEGDRDNLYVGAYLGCRLSALPYLRSLSNQNVISNEKISSCRLNAQNMGMGYDQISFYPLTLLQCLYLIRYKNLDSQTALGKGFNGNGSSATGETVASGMYYGEASGSAHIKFMGIEDFWGNYNVFVEGLRSTNDYHLLTTTNDFNDDGSGYTDHGAVFNSDIYGYMSAPIGTNELGFIPKETQGSDTTYFTDSIRVESNSIATFANMMSDGETGVFCLNIDMGTNAVSLGTSARLMYL